MTVRIKIEVEYEVVDETALRATAVAARGEGNPTERDAIMKLLRYDGAERLSVPGLRVAGFSIGFA